MLIAKIILSENFENEKFQEKNILIKINYKFLTQFAHLNIILNSSMSQNVHLLVQYQE